jgi:hypothetical protein
VLNLYDLNTASSMSVASDFELPHGAGIEKYNTTDEAAKVG